MSTESAKQFLDERIASLSAELDQARSLRAAMENSELFGKVAAMVANGSVTAKAKATKQSDAPASSNKAKIAAFFESRGNAWAQTGEIMDGAGVDRGVVNNVLYVANADEFESKDHPEIKRRKLWRMKES